MDVFDALSAARAEGRTAVLVTVVAVEGHPPSRPGAKAVVVGDAVAAGTLGCSEFDTAAVDLARELRSRDDTATLRRRAVFRHGDEQTIEMFAERYDAPPALYVIGATPVGRAVADFAAMVGRHVVSIPDDAPAAALRAAAPGPRDAVVVSDHDAPYVAEVLQVALDGAAGFVGMLGSRRHAPEVVARLRAAGLPSERLARLHTPCGLDIGSRTPAEIALSIVAEIVAAERGRSGGSLAVDWTTAPAASAWSWVR